MLGDGGGLCAYYVSSRSGWAFVRINAVNPLKEGTTKAHSGILRNCLPQLLSSTNHVQGYITVDHVIVL